MKKNERDNLTILRAFGPDRADLILECVGVQDTITQAIECARKGTTIVVVGVFSKKPVVDLGLVQDRELSFDHYLDAYHTIENAQGKTMKVMVTLG